MEVKCEKLISTILDKNHVNYKTEYSFSDCSYKRKLKFDFAIFQNNELKLLIEFNGEQHYKPVNFFNENIKRNKIKKEYCYKHNIPLLEIPYTEVTNLENIIFLNLKEVGVL